MFKSELVSPHTKNIAKRNINDRTGPLAATIKKYFKKMSWSHAQGGQKYYYRLSSFYRRHIHVMFLLCLTKGWPPSVLVIIA